MNDQPDETDEPLVRPFASVLQEIQQGVAHDELSVAFRDLILAVEETGKGGKLTFTLDVKPLKSGDGVLVLTPAHAVKLPQHDRKASLFYATKNGNVTKDNPNQLDFDSLKVVEGKKSEPVVLDQKNGTTK